jgi:hypothetical protein
MFWFRSWRNKVSNVNHVVGVSALTAVVVKSSVLWDIKPCSREVVNGLFERIYRFYLQG